MNSDNQLSDWRTRAFQFEQQINGIVLGQERAVRQTLIAVFARGHVLLEGKVGVGKTTLLRTIARGLGGDFQRIEGTIDLMPADLIYYTHIDSRGQPGVDPGPLLQKGESLATFFFNEINRARPQVHSLLLRVMAERTIAAFNREFAFPHIQVFADRNPVEKEETFELPAAARDRFMMEIRVDSPDADALLDELIFNPRFHDVDRLIMESKTGLIPYYQLNDFAAVLQQEITTSDILRRYVVDLCRASNRPQVFGIELTDVDMDHLILAGASPRGMSYLIRAARVNAWLHDRTALLPEDVQTVFPVVMAHRIFLNPIYGYRQDALVGELLEAMLQQIAAP